MDTSWYARSDPPQTRASINGGLSRIRESEKGRSVSHGMDSDGSCQNSQVSDASCMSVPLGWATLLMLTLVVNIIHSVYHTQV